MTGINGSYYMLPGAEIGNIIEVRGGTAALGRVGPRGRIHQGRW